MMLIVNPSRFTSIPHAAAIGTITRNPPKANTPTIAAASISPQAFAMYE